MKGLLVALVLLATPLLSEERVVLITGASKGLGHATAEAFLNEGWTVWATSRTLPEFSSQSPKLHTARLDVSRIDQVERIVSQIIRKHGRIDVLVNNAATMVVGSVESVELEQLQRMFDVNLIGQIRLIHEVLPHMRQVNRGHIINISSTSGVRALPGLGAYAATKFAIEGYSEALAVEVEPWNVQVALVQPGPVRTGLATAMEEGRRQTGEEAIDALDTSVSNMLFRVISQGQAPEEVASVIMKIANNPRPDLRNQTSPSVRELIGRKLVDTTGNSVRQAARDMVTALKEKEAEEQRSSKS